MHTHINPSVVQQLKISSRIFSVLILLGGIFSFIGYQWNISFLKNLQMGAVNINPLTALTFILCGACLLLLYYQPNRFLWVIRILTSIILLIGLSKTFSYLLGFNFTLDTLFFTDKLNQPNNLLPNRIAPNTAFCFALSGIALLFISIKKETTGQIFSLIIFLFSLFPIIGYWYEVPEFYGISAYIPMAFNTACCFFFFGLALLFLHPEKGIMLFIANNTVGGFTARIMLPLIIVFSLLIGYYRLRWQHLGWYGTEFGTALLVIISIFFYAGVIWGISYYLFKTDRNRIKAEEKIRQLNIELENRIQQIKENEEKYRLLFDSIDEGYCIIEMIFDEQKKPVDYRFLVINASFERQTGLHDAIGKRMREFAPNHEEHWFETYGKIALTGESVRFQNRAEELHRWYDVYAFRFGDPKNMQVAILFNDISERKQAEETISLLNKDLANNLHQLESVNKELESFSYSVSHDLRAPLRAIDGFANIIHEDYNQILDEEGKRLLGVIQLNAKKMGMLIDDLLAFSRLGKKEVQKTNLDMKELTEGVLLELNKSHPHKAEIKIGKLYPAKGDYALINQVVLNLFSNAIKYSSKVKNPMIEINSEENDSETIYSIKDNGVGFDMQYAHKLFGVFQRLHKMEDFEGTGVGLAIVQRIIHKHGGKVWAEAELGKGATFNFSLPTKLKL